MVVWIVILCVVVVLAIIAAIIIINSKRAKKPEEHGRVNNKGSNQGIQNQDPGDISFPPIRIEELPAELFSSTNNVAQLIEIKDGKTAGRIDNLVVEALHAGNDANNAVGAAKIAGKKLYRMILPAGCEPVKSKEIENAVRGFSRDKTGTNMANLIQAETPQGTVVMANIAGSAMSIASAVVGQYYMSEINSKLEKISDKIDKIADFQNNEYRSRVLNLVRDVKEISEFQGEILENDILKVTKLASLDRWTDECAQLLGQANLSITNYVEKQNLSYEEYATAVKEAHNWYVFQNLLLDMLYRISDLKYTLYMGAASREQCSESCTIYSEQVRKTQRILTEWHEDNVNRLKIDTSGIRRKRVGINGAVYFIPGKINDNLNYRRIDKNTANMIEDQMQGYDGVNGDDSDLFAEDVEIIVKNGKAYYLPGTTLDDEIRDNQISEDGMS